MKKNKDLYLYFYVDQEKCIDNIYSNNFEGNGLRIVFRLLNSTNKKRRSGVILISDKKFFEKSVNSFYQRPVRIEYYSVILGVTFTKNRETILGAVRRIHQSIDLSNYSFSYTVCSGWGNCLPGIMDNKKIIHESLERLVYSKNYKKWKSGKLI